MARRMTFTRPSMAALRGRTGRSILETIRSAPYPDRKRLQAEADEFESRILKAKREENIGRRDHVLSAVDIANVYINVVGDSQNALDDLKLNILCYYAQGWALANMEHPLFSDTIEAWGCGPIIPTVHQTYRRYGLTAITHATYRFNEGILTSDELNLLVDVFYTFGEYTAAELVVKSCVEGSPWHQAYQKCQTNEISLESMKRYFEKRDELKTLKLNLTDENTISYV